MEGDRVIGFIEAFADFMNKIGWMVGLGLFLIFMGLFGYALVCVSGDDDEQEDISCEHYDDD